MALAEADGSSVSTENTGRHTPPSPAAATPGRAHQPRGLNVLASQIPCKEDTGAEWVLWNQPGLSGKASWRGSIDPGYQSPRSLGSRKQGCCKLWGSHCVLITLKELHFYQQKRSGPYHRTPTCKF